MLRSTLDLGGRMLAVIGQYHEHIKIAFAMIAALWVLMEYRGKQYEQRVERAVNYIKQASESSLLDAEVKTTLTWVDPAFLAKVKAATGDREAVNKLLANSIEQSLTKEVWNTFNFYKSLSICVNADLCDAKTACARFERDIRIFNENTASYFVQYMNNYRDDAIKPIRAFLETCKRQS